MTLGNRQDEGVKTEGVKAIWKCQAEGIKAEGIKE
jgi:hypothetical protein